MVKASRLAVIVAIMFVAVLVFWWFGLNEYRDTVQTVNSLKIEMKKMQAHVHETERVLAAVKALELQVQNARSESNEELEDSKRYSGNDRIDRLERLLEADLARRAGDTSACGASDGLSGASGRGGSPGVAKGKQN